MMESFALKRFTEEVYADEAASDIVDSILANVEGFIATQFISSIDIPLALEKSMTKIYKMVEWSTYSHDGIIDDDFVLPPEPPVESDADSTVAGAADNNSVDEDAYTHLEELICDDEPVPMRIDPWARGSIHVRKPVQETGLPYQADDKERDYAPSVGSFKSSYSSKFGARSSFRSIGSAGSRRSAGTGRMRSTQGSRRGSNGSISENKEEGQQVWSLDGEDGSMFPNFTATNRQFDLLMKQRRIKQKSMTSDGEEKEGFDLLQDTIQEKTKDLPKGKYVLDREGNPTIVKPIRPDNLPAYSQPTGLRIASQNLEADRAAAEALAAEEAEKKENKKIGNKKKKKPVVRVAGSRAVDSRDQKYFQPSSSLAVNMAGVEDNMMIQPGVTVRVEENVRFGGPVPNNPVKLSRRQYAERTAQFGSGPTLSNSEDDDDDGFLGSSDVDRGHEMGSADDGYPTSPTHFVADAPSRDGAQTSDSKLPKSMRGLRLPDVDPFAGGRKVEVEEAAVEKDPFEDADPHRPLPSTVSQVAHRRPSTRQKENVRALHGGMDKENPRDRAPPKSMVAVSDRKHLAAPYLGKTTGHGLSDVLDGEHHYDISKTVPAVSYMDSAFTQPSFKSQSQASSASVTQQNSPRGTKKGLGTDGSGQRRDRVQIHSRLMP
jgi:hypothetical protein